MRIKSDCYKLKACFIYNLADLFSTKLNYRIEAIMIKVDSHLHVNFCGFDSGKIVEYLDSKKLDKCWLLSWEEMNPTFESLYKNLSIDNIIEAYYLYPDRIVPFYAPDPSRTDWYDVIKFYHLKGVKGCGELKVTYRWLDDEITNVLDGLRKLKIPLVFHMENSNYHFFIKQSNFFYVFLYKILNGAFNGITRKYIEKFIYKTGFFKKSFQDRLQYFPGYMMDFAGLEQRLKQYPDVNFIAHGPAFWKHIAKDQDPYLILGKGKIKEKGIIFELFEKYDNLYADMSGKSGFYALKRDPSYTRMLLNEFYNKILFGTDNESGLPFERLVFRAGLSKNKLCRIMGGNAEMLCY